MTKRAIPRLAAIFAPLAILVSLLAWGASSPPGSSPDDDYHMASIWCAAGERADLCEEGRTDALRLVPSDLVQAASCFRFHDEKAASCPLDEESLEATKRGNWHEASYPPVYYAIMSVFAGPDLGASILVMRSMNAVLFVGVLTALFFLLPRGLRPTLAWATGIAMIPLGMFIVPSVNPSSWAVLSAAGLWLALSGYLRTSGPRKWTLGGVAALLLLIGAGARSDAAVYGGIAIVVAVVLEFRKDRRFALDMILPAALAAVAIAFFFSGGQSAVVSSETAVDQVFPLATLAFIDGKLLPELWAGVFGTWGLGWLDTTMPGAVWVVSLGVFAAVTFWGLRHGDGRKWAALAGVAAALVVVPMYILLHDQVVIGEYVQPRYIYPLIILLGGVAIAGLSRPALGLSRLQLAVVASGLALANSVALHVNIRRYVTGQDVPNFNLDAGIEWWWAGPITPMMLWAAGSLAFAIALALLAGVADRDHVASGAASPFDERNASRSRIRMS